LVQRSINGILLNKYEATIFELAASLTPLYAHQVTSMRPMLKCPWCGLTMRPTHMATHLGDETPVWSCIIEGCFGGSRYSYIPNYIYSEDCVLDMYRRKCTYEEIAHAALREEVRK
jgi:hypothetical protein